MKKRLALILALCLVLQVIFAQDYNGQITPKQWGMTWAEFHSTYGLGAEVKEKLYGHPFNVELFFEHGIITYGDYSIFSPQENDFKALANGYYVKNGQRGEYRYEGLDVSGNKHNNDRFPRDADGGTAVQEKKWVFQPWEPGSIGYDLYTRKIGKNPSIYNEHVLEYSNAKIAKQINQAFDWNVQPYGSATDTNKYNYISVQTKQETFLSGQGTMIHISKFDNRPWYQSFSLNKAVAKSEEEFIVTANITDIIVLENNDNGDTKLKVRVTGAFNDSAINGDDIKEAGQYYRRDVKRFELSLWDNIANKAPIIKTGNQMTVTSAYCDYEVTIPQEKYKDFLKADGSYDVLFTATARTEFHDNRLSQWASNVDKWKNIAGVESDTLEPIIGKPEFEPPKPIKYDVDHELHILDEWKFGITIIEEDVSGAVDRYIEVDGRTLSSGEESQLLSGNYDFGEHLESRYHEIKVVYVHENGDLYFRQSWVYVFDSRPKINVRVNSNHKVNRLNTITLDTDATHPFVRANTSISLQPIELNGKGKQIYKGSQTATSVEFITKEIGDIDATGRASNEYGETAVVTQTIYNGEDYIPDIIANVWNSVLSRNDKLDMFVEGASVDSDSVTIVNYEILFDADKDGTAEQSLKSGVYDSATFEYQPPYLGQYKIVFTTKEAFGQPTLLQHITEADYKTNRVERDFYVENLIPMNKIYSDIEYNFPVLDVIFMLDQSLDRTFVDEFRAKQVDIENAFRKQSMVANVDMWDLHTYVYSQVGATSKSTGTSYPSSSTYYTSGGYAGTIGLSSVNNYPYSVDEGRWRTRSFSVYATDSRSTSGNGYNNTQLPSSVYVSQGGASGSIPQTSYNYASGWVDDKDHSKGWWWTRDATYGGTIYGTENYWESDYRTYNDYVGHYSGTIYKNVKQTYNPVLNTESTKYIVYVTDQTFNNPSDLIAMKNTVSSAQVIHATKNPALTGGLAENTTLSYTTVMSIVDQVVGHAKAENPINNELAVLINEPVTFYTAQTDAENDPISNSMFQIVHNQNYFDNPLGQMSNSYTAFDGLQYTDMPLPTSFSQTGKVELYMRSKDSPVGNAEHGKDSNDALVELVVHRKPISRFVLDWDYDNLTSAYKTTWVDQSYDPDSEFSRVDKGIIKRDIRYKLTSASQWNYGIPDNLTPGTYEIEQTVQDNYGVYSDVFRQVITLSALPPVQVNASLRTLLPKFALSSIPASESVEFYNIWTRYPYGLRLELSPYNSAGSSRVGAIKPVAFTQGVTGNKVGNDTTWNNVPYQIDATLPDGNYIMRISAINTSNASQFTNINFPITVSTPINLQSSLATLAGSEANTIEATTSIYANSVTVEVFRGTSRAQTLTMSMVSNDGNIKTWRATYTAPNASQLAEGDYQARFTARTPNNNVETLDRTFRLQHLRIVSMNIFGEWNHWRGQTDIHGKTLVNMPHRFMSYEMVTVTCEVEGNPDSVTVRFSPELEAMVFTNSLGHTYRYVDHVNRTVNFPLALTSGNNRNFSVSYILPLANSTMDNNDQRLRPSYSVTVTATKGAITQSMSITDIDITGNITDKIYSQPE